MFSDAKSSTNNTPKLISPTNEWTNCDYLIYDSVKLNKKKIYQ